MGAARLSVLLQMYTAIMSAGSWLRLRTPTLPGSHTCPLFRRLGQLSDGFVEQPADAFPEGRLVVGQVLSTEGGK